MSTLLRTAAVAQRTVGTIKEIYRYPVKSLGGERLHSCLVDAKGVVGDHRWALVDTSDGKLASAKNPRKWGHLLGFTARYIEEPTADGLLPPLAITLPNGRVVRSDQPDVDAVLSKAAGADVHLATMDSVASVRSEMIWHDDLQGTNAFSDGGRTNAAGEKQIDWDLEGQEGRSYDLGTLHLLTSSSLDHMQRLSPDATFDVRRYRPQFLLETPEPGLIESGWLGRALTMGEVQITPHMNTVRCIMTTLPREDLPLDRTTMRAIVKHNTMYVEPLGNWACLGVYANTLVDGRVAVGSTVSISG